jgi:predicted RND superfamily exporter protein
MNMLTEAGARLTGEYYLIGSSAMSREMQNTFSGELWTITMLTAAAIFLIVLATSRSFIVPVLLVLIVQCGVYITVTAIGWQGYRIYFLALLIVECILMGATIDYGILFTGYYRENRNRLAPPEALKAAYDGSIHSIMTSGLIIVLITGIFGYVYPDPTVAEICRTISTGAFSAILVILFMLPGLLAALDRLIVRGKRRNRALNRSGQR